MASCARAKAADRKMCIRDRATAFSKLSKQFGLTQQQIGERVGLSRESVSNYMRLLKLPAVVTQYLMTGAIGFTEARELLKLEDDQTIEKVAHQAVEKHLSLHQLMDVIEDLTTKRNLLPQAEQVYGARWVDPNVRSAQNELQKILGVKVKIRDRKGKGKIVICLLYTSECCAETRRTSRGRSCCRADVLEAAAKIKRS